jgi:hypothetical protein
MRKVVHLNSFYHHKYSHNLSVGAILFQFPNLLTFRCWQILLDITKSLRARMPVTPLFLCAGPTHHPSASSAQDTTWSERHCRLGPPPIVCPATISPTLLPPLSSAPAISIIPSAFTATPPCRWTTRTTHRHHCLPRSLPALPLAARAATPSAAPRSSPTVVTPSPLRAAELTTRSCHLLLVASKPPGFPSCCPRRRHLPDNCPPRERPSSPISAPTLPWRSW